MRRRIIFTIFVAVTAAITCGGIRNNTYAAEHTASTYTELSNYVTNAPAGEETIINITADMNIESKLILPTNSNVTIDGQGYTLTQTTSYNGGFIYGDGADSFALKNITLQGIAGEWEAKWDRSNFGIGDIDVTPFDEIENAIDESLIDLNSSGDVSFDTVTLEGFAATVLIDTNVADGGNINMRQATFSSNYAQQRLVNLYNGSTIRCDTVVFDSNFVSWAALSVGSAENAVLSSIFLTNNWSKLPGEGIDINDSAATLTDIRATDNNMGWAVHAEDSVVLVRDSMFTKNQLSGNGSGFAAVLFFIRDTSSSSADFTIMNSKIIDNNLDSGILDSGIGLFGGAKVHLLDNTMVSGNYTDDPISPEVLPAMGADAAQGGYGVSIWADDEYETELFVDDSVRIYNNRASRYGWGDDIVILGDTDDYLSTVKLIGLEKIADWYIDNPLTGRYSVDNAISFTDFSNITSYAVELNMGGESLKVFGLKAILPEDPADQANPNTVDSFTVTAAIAAVTVITLSGIGLRMHSRR